MAYYPASSFVPQFFTDPGVPLAGGTISAYISGSSTPTPMYIDNAGTSGGVSITLNARGEPQVSGNTVIIWLDSALSYKFVLADASAISKWTINGITNINYLISDTTNVANGDALVGVKRTLTGAIATTLHNWLEKQFANVQADFGATGNGTTDDTAAIQAALTASQYVFFPPGTYKVTATLTARSDSYLLGLHPELCQLKRTTVYGDTITVGSPGTHAGSMTVEGLWFNHTYTFNNGSTYVAGTSTSITNKDPTSVHLAINYGQNVRIRDCWFYGIGYGIEFLDSTVMWIERCLFNGMWDANVSGLQDTTAGIWLHTSSSATRCGILNITGCHIAGYGAAAATNVTTPEGGGTGSVIVSKTLNAGMKYGVYIQSCERFSINDNYIGGQSSHCIYLSAAAVIGHGAIHDNMIDGAADYSIVLESQDNSYFPNFINIHHNTAVGYGIEKGFLWVKDTSHTYSANFIDVSDNVGQYYYRAPMRFEKAKGIKLANNQFSGYNSDHALTTANDPYTMAGAVFDASCVFVDCSGDKWGGAINDPSGTNYCKWGLYFYSTTNNSASSQISVGFGLTGGTIVGGMAQFYPVLSDSTAIAPTYTNSWVDAGAPYLIAGYYLDGFGVVHLQGSIKSGTINTAAFTLPTGYRPTSTLTFAVVSNNTIGGVTVSSAGVVTPTFGNNAYVALDGISFRPN